MRDWISDGYDLTMAINVSPVELEAEGFIENLVNRTQAYGLPPERIELEVTDLQGCRPAASHP